MFYSMFVVLAMFALAFANKSHPCCLLVSWLYAGAVLLYVRLDKEQN
jgi:hypothetical protein